MILSGYFLEVGICIMPMRLFSLLKPFQGAVLSVCGLVHGSRKPLMIWEFAEAEPPGLAGPGWEVRNGVARV